MTSRKTQDALAKGAKSKLMVLGEVKATTLPVGLTRAGAAEKEVAILRERVAEAPERILPTLERIAKALEGIDAALNDIFEDMWAQDSGPHLPKKTGPEKAKLVYTGSPEHVKVLLAEPVPVPVKVLDLKAVQQAFLDVIAKDREHAVRTLEEFGVGRVSALPPEKFQTFVQALTGE